MGSSKGASGDLQTTLPSARRSAHSKYWTHPTQSPRRRQCVRSWCSARDVIGLCARQLSVRAFCERDGRPPAAERGPAAVLTRSNAPTSTPSSQHRDHHPPASTPSARPSLAARPRTLTRPDCALAAPNDGCPGLPRLSPGPSGNICHTLCHACRRVPPSEPDQCRPHVTAFGRPRKSLTPRIGEAKRAAQSRLQPWPGNALQARPRHCRVCRHTSQALTDGPLQDRPERPQGEPLAVVFRPPTARRARQHLLDDLSGVRQPYLVSAHKRRSIHSRSKR